MKFGTKLLAATRSGVIRGVGTFTEHAVRYTLLGILGVTIIYFGWGYLSEAVTGWFHWPEWLHWPSFSLTSWFGGGDTPAAETATRVEIPAPQTPAVPDACDGWGYKKWCWNK